MQPSYQRQFLSVRCPLLGDKETEIAGCVHGLPGWCAMCAGVSVQPKEPFRGRVQEPEPVRFGSHVSARMNLAAAESSRMGDLTVVRSTWRQSLEDRAQREFERAFFSRPAILR